MRNWEAVRQRYMRDSTPVRLGGLAADLARIGSAATTPANAPAIHVLLEEARRFIEWSAPETAPAAAAQLVDMQVALTLWLRAWPEAQSSSAQRALLAHQAQCWADQVLAMSGLLDEEASTG